MNQTLRIVAVGLTSTGVLLGSSVPSLGFFGWWKRQQACSPAYVAPTVSAPVVANYVPQTCYRTQYVQVPVVSYYQAPTIDPSTGCPVTCMRPTTTYVTQARLVPYTTYRVVYSNPCSTAVAPPATTAYYAPTAVSRVGGCSSCGVAPMYSTPNYGAPTTVPSYAPPAATPPGYTVPTTPSPTFDPTPQPTVSASPIYTPPSYAAPGNTTSAYPSTVSPSIPSIGPATSTPSLPDTNSNTTPTPPASSGPAKTFENGSGSPRPTPIQDPEAGSTKTMSLPRVIDPNAQTTSMPVYRPWAYSTVSWPETASTVQPSRSTRALSAPSTVAPTVPAPSKDELNGWRATRRS